MISHPFEIKPSVTNQGPDVLMVTWRGTPAQSVAEIYLPAVSSEAIIGLADRIYGRHRLTATDANTIQFPASDLALLPIPAGTGRYAGLLSVEVHPSMPEGRSFTVSVRQLNQVSATTRTPPPPPPAPKVTAAKRSTASKRAAVAESESESSSNDTFSWRQVQGAFQYTVTVKPAGALLSEQERLVAWLKWRLGVTPATNRWKPVLRRYLIGAWARTPTRSRLPQSERSSAKVLFRSFPSSCTKSTTSTNVPGRWSPFTTTGSGTSAVSSCSPISGTNVGSERPNMPLRSSCEKRGWSAPN
jgi:hypothetical protein